VRERALYVLEVESRRGVFEGSCAFSGRLGWHFGGGWNFPTVLLHSRDILMRNDIELLLRTAAELRKNSV
jgi:hypothetical protein